MKSPNVPPVFRVFRSKGPRRFTYSPRYYSERQERLDKLYEEVEEKKELTLEEKEAERAKIRFRERIQTNWAHETRAKAKSNSNIRLLVILGILCMVVYLLYEYL